MTEDEAQEWVSARYGAAAFARMATLADMVVAEASSQNLVSKSTLPTIWNRHIVDSAQLIDLVPDEASDGHWVDIGSGAGFPGLVIAALSPDRAVSLIEPRRRRVEFLRGAADVLGLTNVDVLQDRATNVCIPATIVSARAVASLDDLFSEGLGLTTPQTIWLLPKGKSARDEVASVREAWHGLFHVEHSVTDPAALIVRASGVRRK